MNIKELIALASIRGGKTQGQLGIEMGHRTRTRISKIGAGVLAADASEIVYLAHEAKLPEVQTLAAIEAERHPELAAIWKEVIAAQKKATDTVKRHVFNLINTCPTRAIFSPGPFQETV